MDHFTSIGWSALVIFYLICVSDAGTNYGNYVNVGQPTVDSNYIEVKPVKVKGSGDKCIYPLLGRGVQFTTVLNCAHDLEDFTMINCDNYYAFFYPDYKPFGLYTDTWGTLVTITDKGCTLRTFQSKDTGEMTLRKEVCDNIKRKIADELAKLEDYWMKWKVNFERKMQKLSPLYTISDPVENQPRTPSLYAGETGAPVSSSTSDLNSGFSSQPLTPSLPPQALTPSQPTEALTSSSPAQPIASTSTTTQSGGRTILGESSMESHDASALHGRQFNLFSNNYNTYDNGCIVQKCIQGRDIIDCFTISCEHNTPNSLAMNGMVLMGHPDINYFSVFSDEPATLYLFERGLCTKKTYSTKGRVTTSELQFLSDKDCVAAKERMKKALKRNWIVVSPQGSFSINMDIGDDTPGENPSTSLPTQPLASPTPESGIENRKIIKVTTSFSPNTDGRCYVDISVAGNGVEDKFTEPCSDKSAESVSSEDIFIFGNPATNSLALYSKEANTLYVIKNKICTKKTYKTTDGVTTSKKSPVRLIKCNEMKKDIANILRRQKAKPSTTPALQQGSGGPKPLPSTAGQRPPVPASSFKPPLPAATTAAGGLQQFKPTYPFKLGSQVSGSGFNNQPANTNGYNTNIVNMPTIPIPQYNQPMFNPLPGPLYPGMFLNPFNQFPVTSVGNPPALFSSQPAIPAKTSTPLDMSKTTWREGNFQRIYNQKPDITIKKNNNGPNGCQISVGVVGRGVNDLIEGDCSEMGTNIKNKVNSYSLAVADPASNSGLYTEEWCSLVVIKGGKCSSRTYESSPTTHSTKITSQPVGQVQCKAVKEKISALLGATFGTRD